MLLPIFQTEFAKPATLPPGRYHGEWSGYVITIKANEGEYRLRSRNGANGSAPCTIEMTDAGVLTANAHVEPPFTTTP